MKRYWNQRAKVAKHHYNAVCVFKAPLFFNYLMEKLQLNCLSYAFKKIKKGVVVEKRRILVLEVGCGIGRWVNLVDKVIGQPVEYVGVDISTKIIVCARRRHPEKLFVICSVTHLPFKSNLFDIVFSVTVLHHIPYSMKEDAIKEVCRVTRSYVIAVEDICDKPPKNTLNWFPCPLNTWIRAFYKHGVKLINMRKHKLLQGKVHLLMRRRPFNNRLKRSCYM